MKFKTNFRIVVARWLPGGVCDDVELRLTGSLPFVPTKGMMIGAIVGDDFREVEQVFWSAGQPDILHVAFKTSPRNNADVMEARGWKDPT